jgi:hypothetical protein
MNAPKQRTTILAATLAVLVSGGVAFQALAEAPLGMRDTKQANFGASAAGTFAEAISGLDARLAAVDAVEAGRFASGATGSGTFSEALDGLFAQAAPAAEPNFSQLVDAFWATNAGWAAFAAPVADDARLAAMRVSGSEQTLFAQAANLTPALDLSAAVAAFGASDKRLSFAQTFDTEQVEEALRVEDTDSLFAGAVEAGPVTGAMVASTELAALSGAYAGQTVDAATEAMRTEGADASLFADAVPAAAPIPGMVDLGNALAGYAVGGALSDQAAGMSGPQAAMRAGSEGNSLYASQSAGLSTALDVDALAAALGSDSMAEGGFAASAPEGDSLQAAMRADDIGSSAFANPVTAGPHAVDFAAIGAALSGEE